MPHPALIEAVRRRTTDTVAALWAEARAEAGRCRDEAERAVEAERAELGRRLRAISKGASRAALAEAERRARSLRTVAAAGLAGRLWTAAAGALPQLRDASYPARFRALAGELPKRAWMRVVVNPADGELAAESFPGSVVATDATIAGGLVAESDGLRVTNTLGRRLAAAWPDLQPRMMNDVIDTQRRPRSAA